MNLSDLTSGTPATKPWLAIVAGSVDVDSLTTNTLVLTDRLLQDSTRLTPYGLWSSTGSINVGGLGGQPAMPTIVGSFSIPAAKCYPGMTTTIRLGGHITFVGVGGGTSTLTIRNAAGTFTHAGFVIQDNIAVASRAFTAEFNVQITAIGAAGVAEESFVCSGILDNDQTQQAGQGVNNTTFSTTAGVQYTLWAENQFATDSTFIRLASASVTY